MVGLHWDYHFTNLIGVNGKIKGVLDFDNAIKGHNLADIGQTLYWMYLQFNVFAFEEYCNWYGLTSVEKKLVFGYFVLHLLAVSRSTWGKESLEWLKGKHMAMVEGLVGVEEVQV